MSKHSIRSGRGSSPSACCRPSSASTRCWRRRSERSFSWSSASFALRSASSRIRRLPPRSAARISTGPLRRSASISASTPSSEPSAISPCTTISAGIDIALASYWSRNPSAARAGLELLRVGVGAVDGHRDRVVGARGVVGDALALEQRAHGLQAVALDRRLLVVLLAGGEEHAVLELALDLAEAPGEERDHAVDAGPVLLLGDVADAGRPAALDVVVEARRARAPPRLRPLAGAEQEDLAEQVERAADALGRRVGAEVGALLAVALAREVDAREVLVERDRDVRI